MVLNPGLLCLWLGMLSLASVPSPSPSTPFSLYYEERDEDVADALSRGPLGSGGLLLAGCHQGSASTTEHSVRAFPAPYYTHQLSSHYHCLQCALLAEMRLH